MIYFFLNDEMILNCRYRRPLVDALREEGHDVVGLGAFDTPFKYVSALCLASFKKGQCGFISSNIKSNIFLMIFFWRSAVIIINGMGRFRSQTAFRSFLIALVRVNKRKVYVIQSYSDFRFFRRYAKGGIFFWLPGSGGTLKPFVDNKNVAILVQRDSKLPLVAEDVKKLMLLSGLEFSLSIVGCVDEEGVRKALSPYPATSVGYVDSGDIFLTGGIFLQPGGYGEGFPHTLADALVSQLTIYISNKEYVKYGLHKLGCRRQDVGCGWSEVVVSDNARVNVSEASITAKTLSIIHDTL